MDNKSLYNTLKDGNFIQSERYITSPSRNRGKAMGYMWEGELEVVLKEGLRFIFYFWHHCYEDDGDFWYPSQEELDSFWRAKFIPKERTSSSELVDAAWYLIYQKGNWYVTKTGTFGGARNKEEIQKSIEDGSWKKDSDLWLLI